ncbi:hypothetical protein Tco_1134478 [Tanacetum coccineum]
MNPVAAQQVAFDNALVAPKKRLRIKKCNARIEFSKPQRETTYQVTLDALKLSPCYLAFLITTEVPEICPRLPNQDFVEPPPEEEMVPFNKELGYTDKCDMLSEIHIDHIHQPWRTFAAIINKCISGKSTDYQKYGALIPKEMINQAIKDSKAYKIYLDFATGKSTSKKASKFKKVDSPSKKLSHVLEEEPAKKPKQANKSVKESTTVPTACVVIRDTPGVFVSKKKAPAKVDRGKGMDLLSDVASLEATQLKKALKKSKQETHKLHASGLGDGVGSQPKVPDESQNKITGINERNCYLLPGLSIVPKYQSKSKNESWGDSEDDNSNDDDSDDVTNDDDDVDSDADVDNEVSDSEKTDFDEDENPNLNQNDDEEEEYEEEYVRTPEYYEFSDDDEEYEELYKDVNVRLKDAKHEEKVKGDAKMTDAGRDDKTKGPMQSSSVSFDFAQFLNLDNFPPVDNEVVSMMNVKVRHEEPSTQTPSFLTIHVMVILETSTAAVPTIPLIIPPITPIPQQVSVLEKELSQLKQVDYSAQLLETIKSQIPAMVDAQLSTRLEDSIQKAFRSYTAEFERKKQSTITESLENVILAKSSSQPKSTYEAASSLTEFEWKKILLDKKQKREAFLKTKTIESYKVVRYRCSFPRSSQNRRDLPRDIPLDRIEVLKYDTKGVKSEKEIMPTETDLALEQTQQGASYEVSVCIKLVEE